MVIILLVLWNDSLDCSGCQWLLLGEKYDISDLLSSFIYVMTVAKEVPDFE